MLNFKLNNYFYFNTYNNKQYNILLILIILLFFITNGYLNNFSYISYFTWIKISTLSINFNINNNWELFCTLIIILMSTLILFYSINYMKYTLDFNLFYIYMSLFAISMVIVVISGNLITLLIGWEGVGIMSYLLINYWNLRIESNKSSIKALMLNKIGDFSIIFGGILIYNLIFTFNNILINALVMNYYLKKIIMFNYEINILIIINILLLLGAISKSAQFLFSTWLPDAMEGPTPVSSLIHSSTMVAAGYILLLKYTNLYHSSIKILILIIIIGLLTNLISTFITLTTTDVKNTLANSTTAQIAYMFFLFGYGYPVMSFLQFVSHAFYKALLFMGFGGLIHQVKNNQDSRLFITNYLYNPILYTCLLIGLINFISIPGFMAHYSKVNLLNLTTSINFGFQYIIWLITEYAQIINFIAGLLLFQVIINYNLNLKILKTFMKTNHSWENDNLFGLFSIWVLAVCSIIFGPYLLIWAYSYINIFENTIYLLNINDIFFSEINISRYLFIYIIIGCIFVLYIYKVYNLNYGYTQFSSVNNQNFDKILNLNLLYFYNLSNKINFLFNNKFIMPATYIKLLFY